jgi:hypothetical protein
VGRVYELVLLVQLLHYLSDELPSPLHIVHLLPEC